MKVLLTGANGFVGSHILDQLVRTGIQTVAILRATADRRWLSKLPDHVHCLTGSFQDSAVLAAALPDVTHVIHCAGCTKALEPAAFLLANRDATCQLLDAVHRTTPRLHRFIYISSLAASRPATSAAPATEESPSAPLTAYGRSKLAGETVLRERSQVPFTILRPAAVYGPRDQDFLNLFRAVRGGVVPMVGGGRQELSLVYVEDLAELACCCLKQTGDGGSVYHVAEPHPVTSRELAEEIARQLRVRPKYPPLPKALLWAVCAWQDLYSKFAGRPHILSRQKFAELVAPGWVTTTTRLERELNFVCRTGLREGLARTIKWYQGQGWL